MSAADADRRVPAGVWGGAHIALTVTDEGARISFDCASGEIATPLVTDDEGRFAIEGVLVAERGGPVRSDAEPERKAARYSGRVTGRTMNLDVTLIEPTQRIGSYVLELGREPHLTKCR